MYSPPFLSTRRRLVLAMSALFVVGGCTFVGGGTQAVARDLVKESPVFALDLAGGVPSETTGHQGGHQESPGATSTVVWRTWTFDDPADIDLVELVSQLHERGVSFRSLNCKEDFYVAGSARVSDVIVGVSASRDGAEVRVRVTGGAPTGEAPLRETEAADRRIRNGCDPMVVAAAWPDPPPG